MSGITCQAISPLRKIGNRFLESEIAKMDEAIKESRRLKSRKKPGFPLAKRQKVEELQNKRSEGARIIDKLNRLLPEGLILRQFLLRMRILTEITGKASSDNRIAMFMRFCRRRGF